MTRLPRILHPTDFGADERIRLAQVASRVLAVSPCPVLTIRAK